MEKKSNSPIDVKVFGLKSMHPNTTFVFDAHGMTIKVSLNIEPEMKKYLAQNNVFKGEKMFVYSIQKHIKSEYICAKVINICQETLLKRCMAKCREAKVKILNKEITILNN